MEVFAQMVAACSSTCPQENYGEMGVGGGSIDNLTFVVDRIRLGRSVFNPGLGSAGLSAVGIPAATYNPSMGPHDTSHAVEEVESQLTRVGV